MLCNSVAGLLLSVFQVLIMSPEKCRGIEYSPLGDSLLILLQCLMEQKQRIGAFETLIRIFPHAEIVLLLNIWNQQYPWPASRRPNLYAISFFAISSTGSTYLYAEIEVDGKKNVKGNSEKTKKSN